MTKVLKHAEDERRKIGGGPAEPSLHVVPAQDSGDRMISTGIEALDRRLGGFETGGVYLVSGTPGPAKLVAALQFLHVGLSKGERVLLLTSIEADTLLDMARAWGLSLDRAWERRELEIVGFRDDFEMRVLRSTEPEDALEELDRLVAREVDRIAVDPGAMFLEGGGRSLLGRAFLEWAKRHPATVCVTLSVDSLQGLPSSAEWLVHATSGVLFFDRLPGGLYQVLVHQAIPDSSEDNDPITLKLSPGMGLGTPDEAPTRRSSDRPVGAADQVLMVPLVENPATDIEAWARETFTTEIVSDPLDAVTRIQSGSQPGCVLVLASRRRLKEAAQVCRALRPLTGAAIVFASDDSIRSTDRVNLLDAGADDCLSGGIDLRELTARIRQAVSVGGKPPASIQLMEQESAVPSVGGSAGPGELRTEVARRSADPSLSVFGLVRLDSTVVPTPDLEAALVEAIRGEEGDVVTRAPGGCLVLLQGARRDSAKAFLARFGRQVESRFGKEWATEVEIMAHPSDKDRIDALMAQLTGSTGGGSA